MKICVDLLFDYLMKRWINVIFLDFKSTIFKCSMRMYWINSMVRQPSICRQLTEYWLSNQYEYLNSHKFFKFYVSVIDSLASKFFFLIHEHGKQGLSKSNSTRWVDFVFEEKKLFPIFLLTITHQNVFLDHWDLM